MSGRTYTDDMKAQIAQHVLAMWSTGQPLYKILRAENMPSVETWWAWVWADPDLSDKVERAREAGMEARLAECDSIADGEDIIPLDGLMGAELVRAQTRADVKRAKLRIETRMKMAAMLKPKRYGARLDLTSDGQALNGKPPADVADRAYEMLQKVEKRLPLDAKARDLLS